jgi:hypothetical protein
LDNDLHPTHQHEREREREREREGERWGNGRLIAHCVRIPSQRIAKMLQQMAVSQSAAKMGCIRRWGGEVSRRWGREDRKFKSHIWIRHLGSRESRERVADGGVSKEYFIAYASKTNEGTEEKLIFYLSLLPLPSRPKRPASLKTHRTVSEGYRREREREREGDVLCDSHPSELYDPTSATGLEATKGNRDSLSPLPSPRLASASFIFLSCISYNPNSISKERARGHRGGTHSYALLDGVGDSQPINDDGLDLSETMTPVECLRLDSVGPREIWETSSSVRSPVSS